MWGDVMEMCCFESVEDRRWREKVVVWSREKDGVGNGKRMASLRGEYMDHNHHVAVFDSTGDGGAQPPAGGSHLPSFLRYGYAMERAR